MIRYVHRRGLAAVGVGMSAVLGLAACGSDDADEEAAAGAGSGEESECAAFEQYGDLSGTTVTVAANYTAPEDQPFIDAFVPFEECTGADVVYDGSRDFEAKLQAQLESGEPPDIAWFPQPGLLQSVARTSDLLLPAPEEVEANVDQYYGEDWKQYGTVDGVFYAPANTANLKSLVWYDPGAFEEQGYEIPRTWDELVELSDRIVADGGKPWCLGLGSGEATGWPATDWIEDSMLRLHGPEVYDQWVSHEIGFNDPQVAEAMDLAAGIIKNPEYVNGGYGDVASAATTTFQDGGLPILDGSCWMHRQASFYAANWPEGTEVAEDGDIFAFYLPPINQDFGNPVLGGGTFIGRFADRPEVEAFMAYLSSPEYVNTRAPLGNFVSPNSELDPSLLPSPIDALGAAILIDPQTTFRFDASDLMPGEVGAGTFWTEMTAWFAEDKPNAEVLDAIEASWPQG